MSWQRKRLSLKVDKEFSTGSIITSQVSSKVTGVAQDVLEELSLFTFFNGVHNTLAGYSELPDIRK